MSNNASMPLPPETGPGTGNEVRPNQQQPMQSPDASRELTAERDRLRAELDALRAEHQKTLATLAEITKERDIYHRELMHITRCDDITITKEELEEVLKNGVSFEETIRQIELELSKKD